jgi:hypothetical protein
MSVSRRGDQKEDIRELAPHIAAVAAAYGDPEGRYKRWLDDFVPGYAKREPWWFWDQPQAVGVARRTRKRRWRDDVQKVVFECPEVFKELNEVEIEVGIWVTCEELRPFYEIARAPV